MGMLFTGLMITKGGPKTLEYNVRFGDPETQTLLPLLNTDLAEIMIACTERWLSGLIVAVKPGYAATIIAVAGGYPGTYERGKLISYGHIQTDTMVFHAGTSLDSDILTSTGGRVIAATSTAFTLENAIARAYTGMASIGFSNMHYRRDIGHRALKRALESSSGSNSHGNKPSAYEVAGVSISSGNELVSRIKRYVASTARPGAPADIGGFGGVFDLGQAGYTSSPTLIGAIDGVGTKLMLAHAMNKHDTIGIDLVAMNVNDLVVQGAQPLLFLDCFSCGKLDVDIAESFVKGLSSGCIEAECALIGGETAEMPGLFPKNGGKYDVVGATVGAVAKGQTLLPDKGSMMEGDLLLGLLSNGCHSNGFTLIRSIVEKSGLSFQDEAPWENAGKSVGESLLRPTKIYVKSIMGVVKNDLVKGMAHITGGGLIENIPRMLPKHLAAELDVTKWAVPEVFRWLKRSGSLENLEFAQVFNTGLGMVIVVAKENAAKAVHQLREAGETVHKVGKLTTRQGAEGCILQHMEDWNAWS